MLGMLAFSGTAVHSQSRFNAKHLDQILLLPAVNSTPAQVVFIPVQSSCFLPPWHASDLPVFCRIEHQLGKSSPVAVKFRLGSVDYVDWLEGKSRFATFAPRRSVWPLL